MVIFGIANSSPGRGARLPKSVRFGCAQLADGFSGLESPDQGRGDANFFVMIIVVECVFLDARRVRLPNEGDSWPDAG